MNNILKQAWFWILLVAVVIAGGILLSGTAEDEDVAIRVNDTTFSYNDFDNIVNQVTKEFEMYGMQASEEEIKEQAIDRAIQEALLVQYADEKELEATQQEIDSEFEELMMMYGAQSEEEFLTELEMQGIEGRKQVDKLIALEVKIGKLIENYKEDVEISDEEMQSAYENFKQQAEGLEGVEGMDQEIPSFEEMEDDLRNNLIQERVTPLLLEKIEELKELADIEIFIDEELIDIEEVSPEDEMPIQQETPEIEIDPEDIEDGEIEINPDQIQ